MKIRQNDRDGFEAVGRNESEWLTVYPLLTACPPKFFIGTGGGMVGDIEDARALAEWFTRFADAAKRKRGTR